MNRIAVNRIAFGILLAGIATPLAAAPLCRDLKGLFTPCPTDAVGHAARAHAAAARSAAPERAERPARPEHPPVIARTKLCHDLKGLFTPCPR